MNLMVSVPLILIQGQLNFYRIFSYYFRCSFQGLLFLIHFMCNTILKKGKDLNSCNSYWPITVACTLSKLIEYVLLPYIDEFVNYDANQFGFRSGLSCQHAHRVLVQLIKEATRNSSSLYFCTHDTSRAFDSVCHAQAWYALSQLGVNASVILVLKFWYSNSYLRLKSGNGDFFGHIPVKCGVGQGGVHSPHIFNASIGNVLSGIRSSCFTGFTDVSYLA